MANLLRATCDCGYDGSACCGSARAVQGKIFWYPHLCGACREVVSVDVLAPAPRCPACGATGLVRYGTAHPKAARGSLAQRVSRVVWRGRGATDPSAQADSSYCEALETTFAIGAKQAYACPKCERQALRFASEATID